MDKICAINELKTLGVIIPEYTENHIIESHKRRMDQRKIRKEKMKILDMTVNHTDDNFAFIAGYTS